jgi:hypothetical protein
VFLRTGGNAPVDDGVCRSDNACQASHAPILAMAYRADEQTVSLSDTLRVRDAARPYDACKMKHKLIRIAGFAATVVAAPALLLAGPWPAHADQVNGNPDVWFDPWPGGLTVHVRSWTGGQANCTYMANSLGVGVSRNFTLAGLATQDVVITPSVPLFRPWDINVSCSNGKSTRFTYWY